MTDIIEGQQDLFEELEALEAQEPVEPVEPVEQQSTEDAPVASIIVPAQLIDIIKSAPSGEKILSSCIDLAVFLSQKNAAYGDSALDPVRIFSKAGSSEQILVRIDDKISRLMRGHEFGDDDTLRDLLGYLLLYFVSKSNESETVPTE
jgi:hypothetical protein